MKDGDDEEEGIGTSRYPCIPSLVALLQMKNRLHLAMLGKKLMKWTALATTKELRKITVELVEVHANYGKLIREAYIELARCRYFCPYMNHMVVESPPMYPATATVTVMATFRSVTGSKVIHYEPLNTKMDNYQYLALPLGGIELAEAKRKWRELLYITILLVELNKNFITIERARNSANKKSNVLGKIVIPRINLTIKYITSELDEKAREDFFRMKKIIKVKEKYRKKKGAPTKTAEEGLPQLEPITPIPEPVPTSPTAASPSPNIQSATASVDSDSLHKGGSVSPRKVDSGSTRKVEFDSPTTRASPAPPSRLPSPAPSSRLPSPSPSSRSPSPAPSSPGIPAIWEAPVPAPDPAPASDNTILRDVETKQITKVTRITRPDGTVVEEIKTIKISKEL